MVSEISCIRPNTQFHHCLGSLRIGTVLFGPLCLVDHACTFKITYGSKVGASVNLMRVFGAEARVGVWV